MENSFHDVKIIYPVLPAQGDPINLPPFERESVRDTEVYYAVMKF